MEHEPNWVGVDWGTSNLRAWGIAEDGEIVFTRASDKGMGKLTPERFPEVLAELLADAVGPQGPRLPVLICGMAGARQGWQEAPYLDAPADLGGLAYGAVQPGLVGTRLDPQIIPGICQKRSGTEDVMRGEETQLLGLSTMLPGFAGMVVLPGTHSKWVNLNGRRVEQFTTFMTGELFEILASHSVLRLSLDQNGTGPERDAGFEAGLALGLEAPERLSALLFKVRSGALLSGRQPAWSTGFLSGLLIGTEIGAQRPWSSSTEIPVIGGGHLSTLYAKGFAMAGLKTQLIEATEATLAGLKAVSAMIGNDAE